MPTILVADDNRNIHKMVESALKDLGYKVESVGNGEHAVQKLPTINPDLILADIYMPVRNGYEVCEYVKNNEKFAHIPVVLLQGKFDPLDESKMRSARADGLLMKPFVPADPLIKMVTDLIQEAAAKRPTSAAGRGSPEKTVEMSPSEVAAATGEDPATMEAELPQYAVPAAKVEFTEENKPLAFGDLLVAPEAEAEPERPKAPPARDGFVASSMASVEVESEAEPVDEVADAEEKAKSWGGIVEESKQPSPDEPPIKVEFSGTPEPMELVTDEPQAVPSTMDVAPLPELATSPDEWMAAAPAASAEPAASVEAPPPAPSVEPPPPPPAPEIVVAAPAPEPEIVVAPPPEPPPLAYEKPKFEEVTAPPAPADVVPAQAPPPEPVAAAQAVSVAAPAQSDSALVDAVVEKVMARLQPQVIEQIAREIVRPLAEALLKREAEK